VQDYLHFTALQSGFVLVPGAIASAMAMVFYGKIAHHIPLRLVICTGALLTTATGFTLMTINPQTGIGQLFWPLICRGLGGVLMFMPLSLATLGPLAKKDIAAGSGFFSLTRQLGSSVGIASITTMLARREILHRTMLVEKITAYRQPAVDRMQMLAGAFSRHGGDPVLGHRNALELIDRIVNGQAMLLSFSDIFFYVAVLFVLSLPLLLLLGDKGVAAEGPAAAH